VRFVSAVCPDHAILMYTSSACYFL
jgi:hypothetical protein